MSISIQNLHDMFTTLGYYNAFDITIKCVNDITTIMLYNRENHSIHTISHEYGKDCILNGTINQSKMLFCTEILERIGPPPIRCNEPYNHLANSVSTLKWFDIYRQFSSIICFSLRITQNFSIMSCHRIVQKYTYIDDYFKFNNIGVVGTVHTTSNNELYINHSRISNSLSISKDIDKYIMHLIETVSLGSYGINSLEIEYNSTCRKIHMDKLHNDIKDF